MSCNLLLLAFKSNAQWFPPIVECFDISQGALLNFLDFHISWISKY